MIADPKEARSRPVGGGFKECAELSGTFIAYPEFNPSRPLAQVRAAGRVSERFGLTIAHAAIVVELAGIGRAA